MPTVPRLDQSVSDAPFPNIKTYSEAPLEAFGGGQSAQNVTNATLGLVKQAQEFAISEREKANEVANIANKNKLLDLRNSVQYDSKTGFKTVKGQDIQGLPDRVGQSWDTGVEEILKGAKNDAQRLAIKQMANSDYTDMNRDLQHHLFSETQQYDKDTTQANIDLQKNMAPNAVQADGSVDHVKIFESLDSQALEIERHAKRQGLDPNEPIVQAEVKNALSKTHLGVIERIISQGQGLEAEAYFNKYSSEITGTDQTFIQNKMEKEIDIAHGAAAWVKVQNFKLMDGSPDEAKMESYVMSQEGVPTSEKIKQLAFVKARAQEDLQNMHREDAARERGFMNRALQMHKQNFPMEEAIRVANATGKDNYQQNVFSEAVQRMYAPPSQSDPITYMGLWEKIQSGKGNAKEVDSAMVGHSINDSDWRQLKKDLFNYQNGGGSADEKLAWDRVKIRADERYGSDKVKRESFMYAVKTSTEGKSPEEIIKIADDKLKNTPDSHWWNSQKQWQVDIKNSDTYNLKMGEYKNSLGAETVNAIGNGVLNLGQKKWGVADVDAFAQNFGGYDNIKSGTPVNNAVQSLIKRKAIVTPANVKAVLEKHPDGNW